uniref:Cysteine sulfinic acid decarboxylase n=1 Tax=Cacopsylla melanoneura TaxID=428564 RepID=A0A8D9B1X8_9HEMI
MAEDGSVCSSGSGESLSAGQLDSGKPLSGELVIGKPLSGQLVSGKPLSGEFVSGKPVSGEPVYRLLEQVLQSLLEEGALDDGGEGGRVVDWKHPEELKKILDLSLDNEGTGDDAFLIQLCRQVIHFSVKTGHRHFLNQLYGGLDPYGLAGAWISEALNTNQYTYEVAPAFTLAEHEVIQKVLNLIGFHDGDGIFSPGGSVSNMYAIALAKYRLDPETKRKGLSHLPPLCMFTSEDSHYSILKAAHWLGIGTDNVTRVKTNLQGQMIPARLEEAIQECLADKKIPLFVNATAGTTVLGAFDPFEDIATICDKYNLWMHVDACWGGSLIFSKKYSSVLKGINRANSVSWNPHKMLGAPLQCSILLIKEKGLLHQSNASAATYLFQQDKFYDVSFDTGDKSIQCGRKVDAFKLWLMWKARGNLGFERFVDNAVDCARYFLEQISQRPGFRLVIPVFQCTNICFWFIPVSMRDKPEDDAWWSTLAKVAPRIKEKLVLAGTLMIGYQPLQHRNLHNFFRLVTTCHPPSCKNDMEHAIQQIELRGAEVDEEIRRGTL